MMFIDLGNGQYINALQVEVVELEYDPEEAPAVWVRFYSGRSIRLYVREGKEKNFLHNLVWDLNKAARGED